MIQKKVNVGIKKRAHIFKRYVSTMYIYILCYVCNVKSLNFFNHELQLTYTESAIKSKLIDLLTQL